MNPLHGARSLVFRMGLLIGGGLLFLMWGLSRFPRLVESVYSQGLYPLLARTLSGIHGLFGTSLAEAMLLAFLGLVCVLFLRLLRALFGPGAKGKNAVESLSGIFLLAVLVAATGYGLWGLNYARPDIISRLAWMDAAAVADPGPDAEEELALLAAQAIALTNHYYTAATGVGDTGSATTLSPSLDHLDAGLEEGFLESAEWLRIPSLLRVPMGRAKPLVASEIMNHLGLSGFYFPWSGEANFNASLPDSQIPVTIAHEKAHQRAFSSEREASFAGFMACSRSPHPYTRYSGYLFAQRLLLTELLRWRPEKARELIRLRLPGVQRDVQAVRDFWLQYEGVPSTVSHSVNHAYLSLHGVEGGIDSYRRSVQLLLLLARHQKGLAADTDEEPQTSLTRPK